MKNNKASTFSKIIHYPFWGVFIAIFLVITFLIIVTVGLFYILNQGINTSSCETLLLDMQASTLAISAISVTLVTSIISILLFFREKKLELNNKKTEENNVIIEKMIEEVEEQKKLLSDLLFWQTNDSKYMLGIQIEAIKKIGDSIILKDTVEDRYQYLLIICSILENQILTVSETEQSVFCEAISKYSKAILDNENLKKKEKYIAVFYYVNAKYREFRLTDINSFRNEVESPLESVKEYIEDFKTSFISFDEHMSSVDLNLFGLIYYWDASHKLNNYKNVNSQEILDNLNTAEKYLKSANTKNKSNIHILNSLGCCYIVFAKYYDFIKHDNDKILYYLRKAEDIFKTIISKDPTYEMSYINLTDICCKKIKCIIGVYSYDYILKKQLKKVSYTQTKKIITLIKEGRKYIEKAEKTGKVLFNVYYRNAELYLFEIFVLMARKNEYSDQFKYCEELLDKSYNLKPTLQALTIKRQLYSLTNIKNLENDINKEIMKVNKENALKWQELKKKNITRSKVKKANRRIICTVRIKKAY